jgi:uncharacterized protein (DUF302 family)
VEGVITIRSAHSVADSMDRLVSIISAKGWTIFARINHEKNARDKGMSLRPAEVLIFGNPEAGTLLMQDVLQVALELPVRIAVWSDENSTTYMSYNDPAWLATRAGMSAGVHRVIEAMSSALATICKQAAEP